MVITDDPQKTSEAIAVINSSTTRLQNEINPILIELFRYFKELEHLTKARDSLIHNLSKNYHHLKIKAMNVDKIIAQIRSTFEGYRFGKPSD